MRWSDLLDRLYDVVHKWHLHKLMRAPFYLLCPMQRLILNSLYQVRLILAHHVLLCLTIYYHYYLIGDFHWLLRFLRSVCGINDHIINSINDSIGGKTKWKKKKTRRECKSLHCNIQLHTENEKRPKWFGYLPITDPTLKSSLAARLSADPPPSK